MRRLMVLAVLCIAAFTATAQDLGVITRQSKSSMTDPAAKLLAAIESSGIYKVFYQLDHAANAEKEAGATLLPSHLILFGNPKGGAPLIKEAPTLALDLPNRALVWQDADGKVWVTYNDQPMPGKSGSATRRSNSA